MTTKVTPADSTLPLSPLARLRADDAGLIDRLCAVKATADDSDRDAIEAARSLAACDGPGEIAAWITARFGYPVSPDTAYAAGFGHAAAMLRRLAAMAEQQMAGAR